MARGFDQPAASNKALSEAANDYLSQRILSGKAADRAREFNVTPRTIQRYRASLQGKGSQKRNPLSKSSTFSKRGKVVVKVKAQYAPGGDPKYGRMRTLESAVPSEFFSQALSNPDDAWQTFLEANNYPDGDISNVQSISFR